MNKENRKTDNVVRGIELNLQTIKQSYMAGELSLDEYAFIRQSYWKILAKHYAKDTTNFGEEVHLLASIFTTRWQNLSKFK